MKQFLVFLLLALMGECLAQTPTVIDFELPEAVKVADFPALSGWSETGKNDSFYWLLDTDLKFYERPANSNAPWVQIPTPTYDEDGLNRIVDFGDSTFISTYEIYYSQSSYSATYGLYYTTGSHASASPLSKICLYTACPNPTNCYPWTGAIIPINRQLFYFNAMNQASSPPATMRQYSNNGGVSWANCPADFPLNVKVVGDKYLCHSNDEMYLTDTPSFLIRDTIPFPDSLAPTEYFAATWLQNDTIILITSHGKFWSTGDLGGNWLTQQLPFSSLRNILFSNDKYWVDRENGFFASENLLGPYTELYPNENFAVARLGKVAMVDSAEWLMGVSNIGIWKYDEFNAQAEPFTDGLPRVGLTSLKRFKEQLYGWNWEGNVWQSTNGVDWGFMDGEQVKVDYSIGISEGNSVAYLSGMEGDLTQIYKSMDGLDWQLCSTLDWGYQSTAFRDGDNLVLHNYEDFAWVSPQCDSIEFEPLPMNSTGQIIYANQNQTIITGDSILIYDNLFIYSSIDRGQSWSETAGPITNINNYPKLINHAGKILLIGQSMEVFETLDWGLTWQLLSGGLPATNTYLAVQQKDGYIFADRLYAGLDGLFVSSYPFDKWLRITNVLRPHYGGFEFLDSTLFFSHYGLDGLYATDATELLQAIASLHDTTAISSAISLQNDQNCSVYPNPTSGIARVQFDRHYELTSISVTNNLGQVVRQWAFDRAARESYELDISGLPSGIYSLNMANEQGRFCRKIIKQ